MTYNILIVDDSKVLRMAIKKTVLLSGLSNDHMYEAGNGQQALDVLNSAHIDFVLLDLNMPVMNGEEFAEELDKMPGHENVHVVVVSTESNNDRLDRMRALGVRHFLRKPFEPEDLKRIVSELIGAVS